MTQATAILTMGLPGSGKSTAITNLYGFDHSFTVIDPDLAKAGHPDYDPKNPQALHTWSKSVTDAQLAAALDAREDVIIDGTGTNAEKMVQRINRLHGLGYTVTVLYVRVSLDTAIARNARRARTVPEEIVREKAELITTAAEIVAAYADDFVTYHND